VADSNWLEKALHKAQERIKEMGSEIGAELKRLGTHGSMELSSALWNGNAFVLYGPGRYTPTAEQQAAPENAQPGAQSPDHDPGRERGGMGR
jgi:hypothetical protein